MTGRRIRIRMKTHAPEPIQRPRIQPRVAVRRNIHGPKRTDFPLAA